MVVTLATVGYGDIFTKSLLGRFIAMITCFWGTFLVSYFVVTVTNMLSFMMSEEKSYTLLLRLHFKEELKEYAVNVLSAAFKQKLTSMRYPDDESRQTKAFRHLRANTMQFKQSAQ